MGWLFKWKIEKVIILPFGAVTIFHEDLNRKIKEEFWIVIMGPIFQIVFTFIVYYFSLNDDFLYYSLVILFFNLLPIFPLDGSKLFNLFLNKFISFKRSHLVLIWVSILSILFLIFKVEVSLIFTLIILFLSVRILKEIKDHNSIFNRFLLERYLNEYHFLKVKKIHSMRLEKMMRDYNHLFYDGNKYVSERFILKKRIELKRKFP